MSKEKIISFFFGAISMLSLILAMVVFAWVAPTQPPPQETVPAPLNVGPQAQTKQGPLTVTYLTASSSSDTLLTLRRQNATYTVNFRLGTDSAFVLNAGGLDILTIKNGKIGIGTTNPQALFHIMTGNTTLLALTNDGKLGIGTSTPPSLLSVQGDTRVTGNLIVDGKIGVGTTNPQQAKLVIEDTIVSPIDSPGAPNSANKQAYGLMVYDPTPVATDKISFNIEGIVKEIQATSVNGHRIGVHGVLINNFANDWYLGGSLAQQAGPYNWAAGVVGWAKSCPSGYQCFSGYFGSTNGTYPFAIASGHLKILSQGAGIYFGGAYNPDTGYTRGGFLSFGDPGYSEDFIGYQNNKFYFRDSPGGGDTNHPVIWAGGYECPSDLRNKENLTKLDSVLEKILTINAYYFNWKDDPKKEKQIGLVAQEVEKYFPELVSTSVDEEGKEEKALDYSRMVAVLLEAIKEQQAEIERLKVEISKLRR